MVGLGVSDGDADTRIVAEQHTDAPALPNP
jgi:hypothetical protein